MYAKKAPGWGAGRWEVMRPMEPRTPQVVKEITVIYTETVIGTGIDESDPCRIVKQYWSLEGELLATFDEWAQSRRQNQQLGQLESSIEQR